MMMSAYMHGSLAVEVDEGQHTTQRVRVNERRKVVVHKQTVPAQEKLLYLFVIVLCVVVASIVIFRYAQIYEVNTNIQHIEKEIERLEMENKALVLSVRQQREPYKLYEKGVELGFIQPSEEAIGQITPLTKTLNEEDLNFVFHD